MKTFTTLMLSMLLGLAFVSCEMPPAPDESSTSDRVSTASPDLRSIQSHLPLPWEPPPWTTTRTVALGQTVLSLDMYTNYKVILPNVPITNTLKILGGKNIIIIGGEFNLQGEATENSSRSLAFQDKPGNPTRTIHLEGLLFDMQDAKDADAIAIMSPSAHYQIQNVRIVNVHGDNDDYHPDAIQNQNGAKTIKIYKATVTTDYQGFFLPVGDGAIDKIHLEKVDFSRQAGSYPTGEGCPYFLWMAKNFTTCETYPNGAYLNKVYATTPSGCGAFGAKEAFPDTGNPPACQAVVLSNPTRLHWPSAALDITGVVTPGPPPGGEYVPASLVGIGYVSPGYPGCGMCE